jgi:hypothetical protein
LKPRRDAKSAFLVNPEGILASQLLGESWLSFLGTAESPTTAENTPKELLIDGLVDPLFLARAEGGG